MIKYSLFALLVFTITFGLFSLLLASAKSSKDFLKVFVAPSTKSTSGAILLGGFPLMAGTFTAICAVFGYSQELILWGVPASLLTIVGFLDDQYEVRARVKLAFQLIAITSFASIYTYIYSADISTFALLSFFGLGVVNGANLLDGIDTYSLKYLSVILTAFSFVSFTYGFTAIALASALSVIPLVAFFFFNNYPSRVHLGEIGGGVIGLNLLFFAAILYKEFMLLENIPMTEMKTSSFLYAFSFLHLPMTELGVSLLRRVINKKSPFCGDKLHIHSLLIDFKGYHPIKAANKLVALHTLGVGLLIGFANFINPIVGFFSVGLFYVSYYLSIGMPYWFNSEESQDLQTLFKSVDTSQIRAYDFSSLNEFTFHFDYVENDSAIEEVA